MKEINYAIQRKTDCNSIPGKLRRNGIQNTNKGLNFDSRRKQLALGTGRMRKKNEYRLSL